MVAIAACVQAPAAHAVGEGELAYLQALNNSGIVVHNTSGAILRGYQTCDWISMYGGNSAVNTLFRSTGWGETPDLATAQIMVDAAANALRPNAGPSLLL